MRLDPVGRENDPAGRENVYPSVALRCFGARRQRDQSDCLPVSHSGRDRETECGRRR